MNANLQLAWLAGILEGEGSFLVHRNVVNGKAYRYPKIIVGMTDLDIIQRVAAMFQSKVNVLAKTPNRLQVFRAMTTGNPAAEWMRALHPMMGVRRQGRIQEILEEWDSRESTQALRSRSCKIAAALRQRSAKGAFLPSKETAVLADFARG